MTFHYVECNSCGCVLTSHDGTIVFPKFRLPFLTKESSTCHWIIQVAQGLKIKLWFASLSLATKSSVVIRDGNSSDSQILETITYKNKGQIEDIQSTFNVISIWYLNGGIFTNQKNTSFQLSYVAVAVGRY